MDDETKDALIERFRAYLDAAGADEASRASTDDGKTRPDLFTLLAELAALKNEVKIESRHVKAALDEFRSLFDTLREAGERQAQEQERRCDQTRADARASRRDLLLELLELRDRLKAGQEQAERFKPGWLSRRRRAPRLIAALGQGMGMNLHRLDEILARQGVRPLPALGEPFNPHCMHAAELAQDPAFPNARVLAELRSGWLFHDQVLRVAEVLVNRIDSPYTDSPNTDSPYTDSPNTDSPNTDPQDTRETTQ